MLKRILPLLLLSTVIPADEKQPVSEAGWFHSNQAGRYSAMPEGKTATGRWLDQSEINLNLRSLWIDERFHRSETTATAVGGFMGIMTPRYKGVCLKMNMTTSQRFWGINPSSDTILNTELYDGTSSFTYLSEAQLDVQQGDFSLRAGRMKIETPYADPDDIRMAPNTFEGAALSYTVNDTAVFHAMYLTRWAGFDSTDDSGNQSGFKRFAEHSDGMAVLGAEYGDSDTLGAGFWYYHADRLFDLGYAEASGDWVFSPRWHTEWGIQAAQMGQCDHSGIEGGVVGAMAMVHYDNLYAGAAVNYAMVTEGHFITDGFGGGPYYTSLDEATIGAVSALVPGHDVSVYRVGGGADLAWWIHSADEGLHLEAMYGVFDPKGKAVSLQESDLMFWLSLNEAMRVDAVFADFDIKSSPDPDVQDFQRYWVRVEYTF